MSSNADRSEPRVKGSILAAFMTFAEQELTPEQREALYGNVDPRREFTSGRKILPTDRVPHSLINRLTASAAELRREPLTAFARRFGRFAAEYSLTGVYRFLTKILQPGFTLSKATSLFSTLNDRGRLEAVRHGDQAATVKLLDLQPELAMCERIHGWLERVNQMSGVRNTVVEQTHCCSRGDDHCEWTVRWS